MLGVTVKQTTYLLIHQPVMNELKDSCYLWKFTIEETLLVIIVDHRLAQLYDGRSLSVSKARSMFRLKEVNNF